MKQNTSHSGPKVRKDLATIQGSYEQERYWFAFKFLSIMDADDYLDEKTKTKRFYPVLNGVIGNNFSIKKHQCKSKFDEIVAIHATTCEHGTNFFPYFHRNLMQYVQFSLNRADKILQSHSMPQNLNDQTLFDQIKGEYQNILQQLSHQRIDRNSPIAVPYWRLDDSRTVINIPTIFTRKSKTKWLDKAYEQLTGASFGWFNYKKQWYDNESQLQFFKQNMLEGLKNGRGFSKKGFDKQKFNRITGKNYDIRDHKEDIKYINETLRDQILYEEYQRQIKQFNSNQEDQKYIITLNPCLQKGSDNNLVNCIYGGKGFKFISEDQKKQFNKGSPSYSKNYNQNNPAYQYANSLLMPAIAFAADGQQWQNTSRGQTLVNKEGFLTVKSSTILTSMEIGHNYMHNNLGYSMQDATYSVIDPLFYVYHSYIDYMLELKIRMIREDYKFDKDCLNLSKGNQNDDAVQKLEDQFNTKLYQKYKVSGGSKGTFLKNLLSSGELGTNPTFSQYKVFDWINTMETNKHQYTSSGFTYQNLMVNNGKIRSSTELDELYNKKRYQNVWSQESRCYDWNYTYDQMQGKVQIPSYLLEIINDLNISSICWLQKYITKVGRLSPMYAQLKYPSNILSQNLQIWLQLKPYSDKVKSGFIYEYTDEYMIPLLRKQILIGSLPLFSKGQSASHCPNCPAMKSDLFEIGTFLNCNFTGLKLDLIKQTKAGVIFDNTDSQTKAKQSSGEQLFKLKAVDLQNKAQIILVNGSKQTTFECLFFEKLPQVLFSQKSTSRFVKENFGKTVPLSENYNWTLNIRAYLESYYRGGEEKTTMNYKLSNKSDSNKFITFPIVDKETDETQQPELYIYNRFKGEVVISSKTSPSEKSSNNFQFYIKNLRNSPTYYFFLSAKGQIIVVDKETHAEQQQFLAYIDSIKNQKSRCDKK